MKIKNIFPDTRTEWIMAIFVAAFVFISGLVVWQMNESSPARWCGLADVTSENTNACLSVLLKLLDNKDHQMIGLLLILGLVVLAIVVVALGVRIAGAGPGGVSVDITADKTKIETPAGDVTIPTPPSEELK